MSASSELRKAVADMTRAVANLSVKPKRKRTRRRKQGAGPLALVPAQPGPSTSAPPPLNRRRRRGRGRSLNCISGTDGEISFCRTERVASLIAKANSTETLQIFLIGPEDASATQPATLPFLGRLFKLWDRARWESLHVEWRPMVAATTSGMFTMGVDWMYQSVNETITSSRVLSLSPLVSTQIAQPSKLGPFGARQMMTRQWLATRSTNSDVLDCVPGALYVYAQHDSQGSDKVLGEVWFTYRVRLSGTDVA